MPFRRASDDDASSTTNSSSSTHTREPNASSSRSAKRLSMAGSTATNDALLGGKSRAASDSKQQKKQKSGGLFNMLALKEPSLAGFEEFAEQHRKQAAVSAAKGGRITVVGLNQQLPAGVPKVNSKWDGLPVSARDRGSPKSASSVFRRDSALSAEKRNSVSGASRPLHNNKSKDVSSPLATSAQWRNNSKESLVELPGQSVVRAELPAESLRSKTPPTPAELDTRPRTGTSDAPAELATERAAETGTEEEPAELDSRNDRHAAPHLNSYFPPLRPPSPPRDQSPARIDPSIFTQTHVPPGRSASPHVDLTRLAVDGSDRAAEPSTSGTDYDALYSQRLPGGPTPYHQAHNPQSYAQNPPQPIDASTSVVSPSSPNDSHWVSGLREVSLPLSEQRQLHDPPAASLSTSVGRPNQQSHMAFQSLPLHLASLGDSAQSPTHYTAPPASQQYHPQQSQPRPGQAQRVPSPSGYPPSHPMHPGLAQHIATQGLPITMHHPAAHFEPMQPEQYDSQYAANYSNHGQPYSTATQSSSIFASSNSSLELDGRPSHAVNLKNDDPYTSNESPSGRPFNGSQPTSAVSGYSTDPFPPPFEAPRPALHLQTSSNRTPSRQEDHQPRSHSRQGQSSSARNFSKPFAHVAYTHDPVSNTPGRAAYLGQGEKPPLTIPRSRYALQHSSSNPAMNSSDGSSPSLPRMRNVARPYSLYRQNRNSRLPEGEPSTSNVTTSFTNNADALGTWDPAGPRNEQAELEQALRKERFDVVGNVDMGEMEFDSRLDGPFDAYSPY